MAFCSFSRSLLSRNWIDSHSFCTSPRSSLPSTSSNPASLSSPNPSTLCSKNSTKSSSTPLPPRTATLPTRSRKMLLKLSSIESAVSSPARRALNPVGSYWSYHCRLLLGSPPPAAPALALLLPALL